MFRPFSAKAPLELTVYPDASTWANVPYKTSFTYACDVPEGARYGICTIRALGNGTENISQVLVGQTSGISQTLSVYAARTVYFYIDWDNLKLYMRLDSLGSIQYQLRTYQPPQ